MSTPNKIEYTSREVIENKLLTALAEEGGRTVAVILSERDLNDLIFAMSATAESVFTGNPDAMRLSDMVAGFRQLRDNAFKK